MNTAEIIEFMKNANRSNGTQKTIKENLVDLGSTEDAADYAMHIIKMQRKQIKKLNKPKSDNGIIQKLEHKVKCQAKELSLLNGTVDCDYKNNLRVILSTVQRKITTVNTNSKVAKITINPMTGRVVLKIPDKATVSEILAYVSLQEMVLKCDTFTSFSYRGNIKFKEERAYITMRRERKGEQGINFSVAL